MKSKKRILYIEANQDGSIGGSHYCLLEIVKHVDKEKYLPFTYFYQNNKLVPEFEKYCKVIIGKIVEPFVIKRVLPILHGFCEKYFVLKKILSYLQKLFNFVKCELISYFRILFLLTKYKIDIIHINNAPVLFQWLVVAKLLRIKCISHLRGNWVATPMQKRMVKYYDRIISISDSVTTFMKNQGMPINNLEKIYDGIDIDAVSKLASRDSAQLKTELNLSSNDFLIGLVGNIKPWKGQHVAIEAMVLLKEKYPDIRLLVVGDVSNLEEDKQYFKKLESLVKKYGLSENVLFLGYRKDIPDIITSINVLIHTSTDPEPLGRVVLEGMLFEKPVIATNHGGPAEILENGITGFLTKPGDEYELSRQIDYIFSNAASAMEMGKQARKELEKKFDIGKNVNEIEGIYATVLG